MRDIMRKLKLTVNETKTRVRKLPYEKLRQDPYLGSILEVFANHHEFEDAYEAYLGITESPPTGVPGLLDAIVLERLTLAPKHGRDSTEIWSGRRRAAPKRARFSFGTLRGNRAIACSIDSTSTK